MLTVEMTPVIPQYTPKVYGTFIVIDLLSTATAVIPPESWTMRRSDSTMFIELRAALRAPRETCTLSTCASDRPVATARRR